MDKEELTRNPCSRVMEVHTHVGSGKHWQEIEVQRLSSARVLVVIAVLTGAAVAFDVNRAAMPGSVPPL